MSREALAIGSDSKPPVLFLGDYSQWKDRFLDFIERQELREEMLTSITTGPAEFFTILPANEENTPPIPEKVIEKTALSNEE